MTSNNVVNCSFTLGDINSNEGYWDAKPQSWNQGVVKWNVLICIMSLYIEISDQYHDLQTL